MVNVPSRARDPYTIRLRSSEKALIEAAAANEPEYFSAYVRRVALEAARRDLLQAPSGPVSALQLGER